jgi:hypothetical protein
LYFKKEKAIERRYIKELLKGSDFHPSELQLIIIENLNTIGKFLVIEEMRREDRDDISGDVYLSKFKIDKIMKRYGKGLTFVK